MNYYYDLLLNFQDSYYMFYEWEENDPIEYIKKIPLFHLKSKNYLDIFGNKIKVNNEFLELIKDKTKLKNNKSLEYACIISDGKNSMALEFNEEGLLINKSSLLLDDEININEFMYSIEETNIMYQIIEKELFNKDSRIDVEIKNALRIEINNIYKNKDYSKLKYIYLEWFNILSDNYKDMYKEMLNRINNKLTSREYEIYELIKMTYNV